MTAIDGDREQLWNFAIPDQGAMVDGRTWGWGNVIASDPWAFYRSSPVAAGEAVVFGGVDASGTILGDTWVFDGRAWSRRSRALGRPGPHPRLRCLRPRPEPGRSVSVR